MRVSLILILIVGLGLFSYSMTMDYYSDKQAAEKLISGSYDMSKSDYYKQEAELRTDKIMFMDLGTGLSIASIIILGFLIYNRVKSFSDLIQIKSINKTAIFILSNVLWLLLIPGTFWYYSFRGGRGDYPPFADSIAIPIFTQIPIYLILLVPLNLFLGLAMIKSTIPTRLFIKANVFNGRLLFWEIFFGFWLLINLFCFVIFVIDGDHFSIPISLFFTYVLLTLRAGQLNKWISENKIYASAQQPV